MMMSLILNLKARILFLIIASLIFTGCGNTLNSKFLPLLSSGELNDEVAAVPLPASPYKLTICSELDFTGVQWPPEMDEFTREAYALALNITGSYEGYAGWSNLSNNFDGQGMSFGLLNQNLGMGTLQPLLTGYFRSFPQKSKKFFSGEKHASISEMLLNWNQKKATAAPSKLSKKSKIDYANFERSIVSIEQRENEDIDKRYNLPKASAPSLPMKMSGRNSNSVLWAKKNLYKTSAAKNFKTEWKSAFKKLGDDPDYKTLQMKASLKLHNRSALNFMELDFLELRAYLFLFDIIVQNGGLRTSHKQKYYTYRDNNPKANEEKLLLELLEIRLVSTSSRWRNDVRKRKSTIILGQGKVHSKERHLPKEYCYEQTIHLPL